MEEIKKVIRGEVLDLKNLSLPYKDKIAKQWKNIDIRQIVVKKWNGSILRRQYMLREQQGKKRSVCGFYRFGEAKVNMEGLWQVLSVSQRGVNC